MHENTVKLAETHHNTPRDTTCCITMACSQSAEKGAPPLADARVIKITYEKSNYSKGPVSLHEH